MTHEDYTPLHRAYCRATRRDMVMSQQMHWAWHAWVAQGWTENDIFLVVAHIEKLIKLHRRRPESLRFHNLIGNTERFLEDVSEARALARQPKPTPRDAILRSTHRPAPEQDRVRSVQAVMKEHELMSRMLREYRETM